MLSVIISEYFAVYFVQICFFAQIQSSIKGCDPNRKSPFSALSGDWTRLVGMRSCVHFLMTLNLVCGVSSPKFRIRNPESFYFLLIPNINMLSYGQALQYPPAGPRFSVPQGREIFVLHFMPLWLFYCVRFVIRGICRYILQSSTFVNNLGKMLFRIV